ncbi:MAG: hypothetical protein AB1798_20345 [Spirochaetota bacterium]
MAPFLLIFIFIFPSFQLFSREKPQITPGSYYVELGKKSEPLSVDELIEGALRLSGTQDDKLDQLKKKMHNYVGGVKTSVAGFKELYDVGNGVLEYMHKYILREYSEFQTRLDVLLETGGFNCVSSAVLFMILGRAVGLTVQGVSTADHVFCSVIIDGTAIDVETTNPYGFDPGTKREFFDAFGNTGYTYVPPGNYRLRNSTGEKGLLSFILQNRISMLEKKNAFAESIELASNRYALLKNESAYKDMVREFINYAAYLNQKGEYAEALDFLDTLRALYGEDDLYIPIANILVYNQAVEDINAMEYQAARAALDKRVKNKDIAEKEYHRLLAMISEREAYNAVQKLAFDEALRVVQRLYTTGSLQDDKYREYVVYLFGKKAEDTAVEDGWLKAAEVLKAGVSLIGQDQRLVNAWNGYRANFANESHNKFADLFNSRKFKEAKALLESALENVPDSTLLQKDLKIVNEQLSR